MRRTRTISRARERLSVFAFAAVLVALYVGLAFRGGLDSREAAAVIASIFGGVHDFFHSGTWRSCIAGSRRSSGSSGWRPSSGSGRTRGGGSRIRLLIALATLLGAVPPFLGPLVYMLFRPPGVPRGRARAELEIRVIESRLGGHELHCTVCGCAVDSRLPRLPGLHDEAPSRVRDLPPAARAGVAGVPVLRDAGDASSEPVALRAARAARARAPHRRRTRCPGKLRGRMALERTLILAKPDAVGRNLAGEIMARFERRGLELRAARLLVASTRARRDALRRAPREAVLRRARRLHHLGADARDRASRARARSRPRARRSARRIPAEADPGSLRGEFALAMPNNLVHGSDSPESAEREIGLWFADGLV